MCFVLYAVFLLDCCTTSCPLGVSQNDCWFIKNNMKITVSCSFKKKFAFPDVSLSLVITWELGGGLFLMPLYLHGGGEVGAMCWQTDHRHTQKTHTFSPAFLTYPTLLAHTYLGYRLFHVKTWTQIMCLCLYLALHLLNVTNT